MLVVGVLVLLLPFSLKFFPVGICVVYFDRFDLWLWAIRYWLISYLAEIDGILSCLIFFIIKMIFLFQFL